MLFVLWIATPGTVDAGELTRDALGTMLPDTLIVGEKGADLPVWPLFKEGPVPQAVGFVFESIDFAKIPGFAGTPMNLLVAIDTAGQFVDVRVISQHEPVFVGGLGEEPLIEFIEQYPGKSLLQNIRVGSTMSRRAQAHGKDVLIDGVAKATVSVRILNQTLISSALQVARAKLGFAQGKDPSQAAKVRTDFFVNKSWATLLKDNLVVHNRLYNRDVQQIFAGTIVEDVDDIALSHPDERFIDLYVAIVSVPTIGRALFDAADLEEITRYLEPDDHAVLVMSSGRYSFIDDDFVRGATPNLLSLTQEELPMEFRDMDVEVSPILQGTPKVDSIKVFKVASHAGLDPGSPWQLSLHVVREKGQLYPQRVVKDIVTSYDLPERFVTRPVLIQQVEGWRAIWVERAWEIFLLLGALTLLTAALIKQEKLFGSSRILSSFRYIFLAFTLGFIGWYAQGQLSIVNITALLQAFKAGSGLGFFLYDPMTVLLWGFVLVTLIVWGRGTFCGWLCPFGALQEFFGKLAQRLGVPQVRINEVWDERLKNLKYIVLAIVVLGAALSTDLGDKLVEVEPFKTAITLVFDRSWPFVGYAVMLLVMGAFIYKFFCRYLCPLGAALAVLGSMRRLDWLTRRSECGSPCQLCRRVCEYNAIEKEGRINYRECFQCLDCVSIYNDPERCVAEVVLRKRGRRLSGAPASAGVEGLAENA